MSQTITLICWGCGSEIKVRIPKGKETPKSTLCVACQQKLHLKEGCIQTWIPDN